MFRFSSHQSLPFFSGPYQAAGMVCICIQGIRAS